MQRLAMARSLSGAEGDGDEGYLKELGGDDDIELLFGSTADG